MFAGMEYDGATSLFHTLNRYYSPQLQRWLSEDPVGVRGGSTNFPSYAGNDPIDKIDPTGLEIDPVTGIDDGSALSDGALASVEPTSLGMPAAFEGRYSLGVAKPGPGSVKAASHGGS
ncbi:MAG TPA: RHS repeat-associated core domain-containing protein, partial [Candidatus Binataceae bacterium]|nr:RHS repeat-associated core domain-containing protein [Candidatus Binataceae bacterium]